LTRLPDEVRSKGKPARTPRVLQEISETDMGASIRHVMQIAILLAALAPALLLAPLLALAPSGALGQGTPPEGAGTPRIGPISGLPLPRYVALRAPEVNLRTGPGLRYPIEWVYAQTGLPVEVIDEFETWRRIRDWEGSIGWVHQNMLTGDRQVLVIGKQRLLRRTPEEGAAGQALLEAGVTGKLNRCSSGWCEIEVGGRAGWLRDDEIYGVAPGEEVR
jgi:SH3-like domain-containing protein